MSVARPASLASFFARSTLWFLALTALWVPVAPWVSYPAAGMAHIALGNTATEWIRKINKQPGMLIVETRIAPPSASLAIRQEAIVEASTINYAYGLPLFLALLLGAHSPNFWRRAALGYVLLLFPLAFSLCFSVLREIVALGASPDVLGISHLSMQSIKLGGLFGGLLLPTLAPVIFWFWLDRAFFAAVVADGWLRRQPG